MILRQSSHQSSVLTWARLCPPSPTHQNDPQTPQVTGLIVAVIFEYLWCCVLQREAGSLEELIVWRFEASKAEVYDFYLGVLTLVCEEQVLQSNWRHKQQSFLSALQNWSTWGLTKLDIKTCLTRYFWPTLGSNNFTVVVREIAESQWQYARSYQVQKKQ